MYSAKHPAKLTESFLETGWVELSVPVMGPLPGRVMDLLWEMVKATFQVKGWDLPTGPNRREGLG